jgi:hypothetical protein
MSASYNDPVVAIDELGREIRATRTGQRYLATDLTPSRPQATSGRGLGYNILDNIIGYDDGVDTPGERAGAAIGAIASDPIGAARGAVGGIGGLIQRLVGGTGTMGDVIDATGLLNVGSLAATAPRGALRAGAARNVDEYAGSHRAPSREYGASLDDPREMFGGDDIYSENAMRYFGHGDTAMDRESIRAINAARGNPDAEITVYRAVPSDLEGAVVNAGDWVTPSRKYAEMHGEGPLGGDYQIIEERVRAGDLFTDGDIHEWGYTPEPQTPAQRVAGLLSSGRADEVTDEMMAEVDPQEMARLYASGATGMDLPMDEASRMARAREMGFTKEAYHGSGSDFQSIDPEAADNKTYGTGIWLTDNPDVAATYTRGIFDNGQTYPLLLNTRNFASSDWRGRNWGDGREGTRMSFPREYNRPSERIGDIYEDWASWPSTDSAARAANQGELSGLQITDVTDIGPNIFNRANRQKPLPETAESIAVFDPTTVRSRFARFDPRLSHLSNLNAANASPLLGGAVLAAPQEQPDPLRNLRGLLAR